MSGDEMDEVLYQCRQARHDLVKVLQRLDDALKASDEELLARTDLRNLETTWRSRARSDKHRQPARPSFGGGHDG